MVKKVAPTTELRKWFNHEPKLYAAFSEKYAKELRENSEQQELLNILKTLCHQVRKMLFYYMPQRILNIITLMY